MNTIVELQDAYVKVEQKVAALWPAPFSKVCAECSSVCCRSHMAESVLESWWLKSVSERLHGKWWHRKNENPLCVALTENGCLLQAGKPPFCYSFYCDRLLASIPPHDMVAYLFLSNILSQLCKLDNKHDLLELSKDEALQTLPLIGAKIDEANVHLRRYESFLGARKIEQAELAFQMLVHMPSILTKSVRRAIMAAI